MLELVTVFPFLIMAILCVVVAVPIIVLAAVAMWRK